jgi:hypothetical protein
MSALSLPILDFIASAQERNAGLKNIATNNSEWLTLGILQIEQLPKEAEGWTNFEHGFTGEDLRNILTSRIGKPSSPHGWGSLIMHAVRRELIVNTGRYIPMKDVRSHARKTALYTFSRGP